MLGDPGDPRFFLYPFAAAVFAAIGAVAILRAPGRRVERRLAWFGLGFLAALTALYMLYVFTDAVFILPATFVLFIAAGCGVAEANRWRRDRRGARGRSGRETAAAACVIALDVLLALSLASEAAARIDVAPRQSRMVPALVEAGRRIPAKATVVSNISLLFLQLYVPGSGRDFIGLTSYDPGERFTDYHLHRLYVKRAHGWDGPVPPVLFDNGALSAPTERAVAADSRAPQAAFLLLAAPESAAYGAMLRGEVDRLSGDFELQPVMRTPELALYKLSAR
jgi:hypothetical protein